MPLLDWRLPPQLTDLPLPGPADPHEQPRDSVIEGALSPRPTRLVERILEDLDENNFDPPYHLRGDEEWSEDAREAELTWFEEEEDYPMPPLTKLGEGETKWKCEGAAVCSCCQHLKRRPGAICSHGTPERTLRWQGM